METRLKTVIVGTGVGGLTAAAQLIKKAKENPNQMYEVHIIEKRKISHFTRRQKLINNKNLASKLIDWDTYCCETFNIPTEADLSFFNKIPLSKEEKFVQKLFRQRAFENKFHALTGQIMPQNFSIKELQNALYSHIRKTNAQNIHFYWYEESCIALIDFAEKFIQINHQDKKISFDHLLICDGTKSETTLLVNKMLTDASYSSHFTFENAKVPTLYHCGVRIKLKSKFKSEQDLTKFLLRQQTVQYDEHQDRKNIITDKILALISQDNQNDQDGHEFLSKYFFLIDDNFYKQNFVKEADLRFYVTSEIPEYFHFITNQEKKRAVIIDWAILHVARAYNLPEDFFEFDSQGETEQHKINATTFSDGIRYCLEPVMELDNGIRIILIGDACMSNSYILGYSSRLALNQAISAVNTICSSQSIKEYNDMHAVNKERFLTDLNSIGSMFNRNFEKEYAEVPTCRK